MPENLALLQQSAASSSSDGRHSVSAHSSGAAVSADATQLRGSSSIGQSGDEESRRESCPDQAGGAGPAGRHFDK